MKGVIFTYVLCYGGSVASLFNPYIGLLIYFCFDIISPESLWYYSVPRGRYSRTIALALLAGWAFKGFGNWNMGRGKAVIYSLIGFWIWAVISVQFAFNKGVSWGFIEPMAKTILPVVVGITLMDSVAKLKQLAWVLMLSQGYLAWHFNNAYFFDGYNWLTAGNAPPIKGLDNNSICIAMICGSGLAFFLGLRAEKKWMQWLSFFAAGLMAHVTMFGDSRGGMLALVCTGVVSFFIVPKKPKHYLMFLLAVVVGLRLAGPAVVERFMTIFVEKEQRDKSAQSRLDMWEDCTDVMLKNPVFGVGPNGWPLIAPRYGWPKGKEAHSLWFQTGAEMGFPGLVLLLSFYLTCVWRLFWVSMRKNLDDPWLADSARMVIAALAGFGVSASFVSLEGLEIPYYVTLLGAGTLKLAGYRSRQPLMREVRVSEAEAPLVQPQYQL